VNPEKAIAMPHTSKIMLMLNNRFRFGFIMVDLIYRFCYCFIGTNLHTFQTTCTIFRMHDFNMSVTKEIYFPKHIVWAYLPAIPAGLAITGVKVDEYGIRIIPVFSNFHTLAFSAKVFRFEMLNDNN